LQHRFVAKRQPRFRTAHSRRTPTTQDQTCNTHRNLGKSRVGTNTVGPDRCGSP
jgi:hypothetical protein